MASFYYHEFTVVAIFENNHFYNFFTTVELVSARRELALLKKRAARRFTVGCWVTERSRSGLTD